MNQIILKNLHISNVPRRYIHTENQVAQMAPNPQRRDVDYQGSFEILQNGVVKIAQDCEVVDLQAPINTINQRSPPSMSSPFRVGTEMNTRPRQVPVPVISRATEVPNSVYNQT